MLELMIVRLTHFALVASLLLGTAVHAQPTVFVDNDFDVANDWTTTGPFVDPKNAEGAFFGAQQITGADPFMEVALTLAAVNSGSVSTWGVVINDTMVWDPDEAVDGALGKLDLSFHIEGGGAWSLAVKQGEFVWYALAKRFVRRSNDPRVITIKGLSEQDFVALPGAEFVFDKQPMHPDFSANAPPISLGIGVGFSCPATSNCSSAVPRTIDIDDLVITAYPYVPLNGGHNGNWWGGLDRNGEGVQVEISDGGGGTLILVATLYSYSAEDTGKQIFMIAVRVFDPGKSIAQITACKVAVDNLLK